MAVADASAAGDAAARGHSGRAAGAAAGLLALVAAAGLYTQIGTLGLGLAPAVALLLCTVPLFLLASAGIRRLSGARPSQHASYPFQLALPSLAYYAAFFLVPLVFLLLFAVSTPLGFGEVAYGFDLTNFRTALDGIYVEVFLRTLRSAAVATS